MVDIFWKNARNWQAVLRAVRERNEGGTVGVFLVLGIQYVFVVSYVCREAELDRLSQWLLVL